MGYNGIKTFTNEPWIASDINTYLSDNIDALKNPPSNVYTADEASNYTTGSSTFTNVDGTDTEGKFRHTITTTGGAIFVHFHAMMNNNTNPGAVFLTLTVNNATATGCGDDGVTAFQTNSGTLRIPVSFTRLLTGYAAGTYIIRLQWKVTAATTGTLYAGAGTASADVHPQFWVREIS